MSEVAEFVAPGRPLRKYRVSLPGGGQERTVTIEDRKPFTRRIVRHFEQVRDLGDGRKKLEVVPKEIEHTYDMTDEMRCDAVRAYNADGTSFSGKQLMVEDLGPVRTEQERPQRPLKHENATTLAK